MIGATDFIINNKQQFKNDKMIKDVHAAELIETFENETMLETTTEEEKKLIKKIYTQKNNKEKIK